MSDSAQLQPLTIARAEHLVAARRATTDAGWSVVDPPPTAHDLTGPEHRVAFAVEAVPVGYATLVSWLEQDGVRLHLTRGWVHPDHRGIGIGTKLVEWADALVARGRDGLEQVLGANAVSDDHATLDLLHRAGFREAFRLIELSLADPTRITPSAIVVGSAIRMGGAADMAALTALVTAAYAGRPHIEPADPMAIAALDWTVVVDPTGRLVAGVGTRPSGPVLEVAELVVDPAHRRVGHGRAVLTAALAEVTRPVHLSTGATNPCGSVDLYASLGFAPVRTHLRLRRPLRDPSS